MCIIIAKPEGKILSKDIYEECFRSNPDGAGFAYVKDNKLVVDKGHFIFDRLYDKLRDDEKAAMLVHFRIATHGEIGKDNCHPFLMQSKQFPQYSFALVHNGVLQFRSTQKESDTACFIADVLQPTFDRDPYYLDYFPGRLMLERTIGSCNKMVIMRHDSVEHKTKVYIINEVAGNKNEGCWFSNMSWKKWTRPNYSQYQHEQFDYEHGEGMPYERTKRAWRERNPNPNDSHYLDKTTGKWTANPNYVNPGSGKHADFPKQGPAFPPRRSIINPPNGVTGAIVPRDPGVITEIDLKHLSKEEQKILRRLAHDWCKEAMASTKGFSSAELIAFTRSDIRETFAEFTKDFTVEALDSWMIRTVQTGKIELIPKKEPDPESGLDTTKVESEKPAVETNKP